MTEELNKVDARQGDRRKVNMRVLLYSLLAIVGLGFVALYVI